MIVPIKHARILNWPSLILLMAILVSWAFDQTFNTSENWGGIETVRLPQGKFEIQLSGVFLEDGSLAEPPKIKKEIKPNIYMMKYNVKGKHYQQCVNDRQCSPTRGRRKHNGVQTGVNFDDAVDFASWLSKVSGQTWRLPTDTEWSRAAAEKYIDLDLDETDKDPSVRWIEEYWAKVKTKSSLMQTSEHGNKPDVNSLGIVDIARDIWDWTSTCLEYNYGSKLNERIKLESKFCGRRVAAGRHRAYIMTFIRDPSGGGCGSQTPPDYLGIRLVREL